MKKEALLPVAPRLPAAWIVFEDVRPVAAAPIPSAACSASASSLPPRRGYRTSRGAGLPGRVRHRVPATAAARATRRSPGPTGTCDRRAPQLPGGVVVLDRLACRADGAVKGSPTRWTRAAPPRAAQSGRARGAPEEPGRRAWEPSGLLHPGGARIGATRGKTPATFNPMTRPSVPESGVMTAAGNRAQETLHRTPQAEFVTVARQLPCRRWHAPFRPAARRWTDRSGPAQTGSGITPRRLTARGSDGRRTPGCCVSPRRHRAPRRPARHGR